MNKVFADTLYWYGLANPQDDWHPLVIQARAQLGNVHLVTTDEVLTEFLAAISGKGANLRAKAARAAHELLQMPDVTVLPQSRFTFLRGLALYERRADKQYSLTDCISMTAIRDEGILEVLTNDHHFEQEGFRVLIRR